LDRSREKPGIAEGHHPRSRARTLSAADLAYSSETASGADTPSSTTHAKPPMIPSSPSHPCRDMHHQMHQQASHLPTVPEQKPQAPRNHTPEDLALL